jgi:hypothetical protein
VRCSVRARWITPIIVGSFFVRVISSSANLLQAEAQSDDLKSPTAVSLPVALLSARSYDPDLLQPFGLQFAKQESPSAPPTQSIATILLFPERFQECAHENFQKARHGATASLILR